MIYQELTYWITLALIPKMWTKRKNEIYVKCFQHVPQLSIIDLFEEDSVWGEIGLSENEQSLLIEAHRNLANNSFLVEELLAQGYKILPLHSEEYPSLLKKNLGYGAPTVLFAKGNLSLLQEPSIAIVGSRKADTISLEFTDNVAKNASFENKVVVSGFAKGVDRQALDSALASNGRSIIVLPQGIMTFSSGFKQYFKHISQGKVLVISSFAPKAPWSVEFAMARNPIIYGMASEIFVAQSDEKGGTWSGVIDGLRKNRTIYVRYPDTNEKNANILLIQKGAKPVNNNGKVLSIPSDEIKTLKEAEQDKTIDNIKGLLSRYSRMSSNDLITRLQLDWSDPKMKKFLETIPDVLKFKDKNRVFYKLKGQEECNLFSNVL